MFHGHRGSNSDSKSPTYMSWEHMIQRCRQNHKNYEKIFVCERWSNFKYFLEDMGERPENTSLDRVRSSEGYCKDNCRWADRHTQNVNRSCMVTVNWKGKEKSLAVLCKELGVSNNTVRKRMIRGWAVEDAVNMDIKRRPKEDKTHPDIKKQFGTDDSTDAYDSASTDAYDSAFPTDIAKTLNS